MPFDKAQMITDLTALFSGEIASSADSIQGVADAVGDNHTDPDESSPESFHVVGGGGEPAYQNSWVAYGTASFPGAEFYKYKGRVYLRGAVKGGTPGAASTIFTLPSGYFNASHRHSFVVWTDGGAGHLEVQETGAVIAYQGGTGVFFSLAGVSFQVDQ